jgi:hypothetical protein
MFRQITAILFLVAFSAHIFDQAVIVLEYYANTAAFAKSCENKARPTMHCKGKCQLMKKLKEEGKKEQQFPERKGSDKNEVVSSRSFFASSTFAQSGVLQSTSSFYFTSFPQGFHSDIFHPPGLV